MRFIVCCAIFDDCVCVCVCVHFVLYCIVRVRCSILHGRILQKDLKSYVLARKSVPPGQNLEAKVLKDSLAVHGLLGEEAGGGDHGEAAVVQLLVLHLEEALGVLGHEVEGVETEVAGDVVGLELSGLVDGVVHGVLPALLEAEGLGGTDGGDEEGPEEGRDLGDVGDGRSGDLGVEEEAGSLHLLADEEADGGEHGDAAVGELGLTVLLDGSEISVGCEPGWVKVANGGERARETEAKLALQFEDI